MGDVDMLGKATEAVHPYVATDLAETVARAALEAAGVLGANAQPPPVHQAGEPSMHMRVIDDTRDAFSRFPGWVLFRARLLERMEFGLAKYGTVLQVGGPRDTGQDIADEMADAVAYAQQGLERALRANHAGMILWWRRRRDNLARELIIIEEGVRVGC